MAADAGPVFIVSGVVLGVLALWAIWVNVRPFPPWKAPDAPPRDSAEKTP